MLEQSFRTLADFYRSRLRHYWVIRIPKEAVWTAVWFTRWKILRPATWFTRWKILHPAAVAVWTVVWFTRWKIVRPAVQALISSAIARWRRWRRWCAPSTPLLSLTPAAASQAGKIETLSAPERVATPVPGVYPAESRYVLLPTHESYEFPSIVVAELFDAEVYGCSNLMRSNGLTVHHDLYRFSHDFTSEELHGKIDIDPRKNVVKQYLKPEIRHHLAVAASFTDSCSQNYAHWLTEVLPRINLFCRLHPEGRIPLIVDAGLHANVEESLRAVAGDKADIIRLGPEEAARVKRLLITSPTGYIPFDCRGSAKSGHSHGIFSPYALTLMCKHLGSVLEKPVPALPTRVFLRRGSLTRTMRNEPQIEAKLVSRGFSIIQPESLSFAEQYQLFANAEVIVGATGAGLANLVFCSKSARVIICLSTHPTHKFWYWPNMAAALGNTVNYVFGPYLDPAAPTLHTEFRVDAEDVIRAIEQ